MLRSISEQGRKLINEDITNLERELEHKIPDDYKRFLIDYNGGDPQQNCHDMQNTAGTNIGYAISIRSFFSIGGPEGESDEIKELYSIEWNYSTYRGRIPEDFLPIGECACGDIICISLYGENEGCVWFWDHEAERIPPDYSNCYKVADSFQALLDGLFEYDYENDVRIP